MIRVGALLNSVMSSIRYSPAALVVKPATFEMVTSARGPASSLTVPKTEPVHCGIRPITTFACLDSDRVNPPPVASMLIGRGPRTVASASTEMVRMEVTGSPSALGRTGFGVNSPVTPAAGSTRDNVTGSVNPP